MKRRILVTSIVVFLTAITLINVEPAGITAEEKAITAMQDVITSPEPQPAANQSTAFDAAAAPQAEAKAPDQTVPTRPVAATDIESKISPEGNIQTEATTSPPKSSPSKETKQPPTVQPPATATTSATAQQKEMLGYINAARAQANLAPLVLDSKLCNGAYLKSQDMAVNGYFSHTSPTYGTPFEMMRSIGITYRTAGENIARNHSVLAAYNAFMNSSGHRANILNPAFNKIGLGFYQRGSDLFVTQWFTN
ncbi:MAG: CAP domain-containing protein [Syntrophomonadaceae bacterium]